MYILMAMHEKQHHNAADHGIVVAIPSSCLRHVMRKLFIIVNYSIDGLEYRQHVRAAKWWDQSGAITE